MEQYIRASALLSGIILMTFSIAPAASDLVETCAGERFEATCQDTEVLLLRSAEYGRRNSGRCIVDEPHMGCATDVLLLLDRWCSGRKGCDFHLPKPELEELNQLSASACQKFLKKYLEVDFQCVQVQSKCSNGANDLHGEEGLLSSHVTDQTACGTSRSPWKISVSQGKTINLTLLDFGGNSQSHNYASCQQVYGYIVERSLGINNTICGGQSRERALYASKTNSVEVHLIPRRGQKGPAYLISYKASGCEELSRPSNAWYKREGSEAVIGCETNNQEWRLTCTGNTWQGTVGNCSTQEAAVVLIPEKGEEAVPGFNSVIVMTSMICGVFIAVVIAVMCGVIYLKKYRMKQETKRIETTYATMEKQHHSLYRPVHDNGVRTNPTATDAPSERLVDVPGTWVHPDTLGRHGTMTSYPDQHLCPTLSGVRS